MSKPTECFEAAQKVEAAYKWAEQRAEKIEAARRKKEDREHLMTDNHTFQPTPGIQITDSNGVPIFTPEEPLNKTDSPGQRIEARVAARLAKKSAAGDSAPVTPAARQGGGRIYPPLSEVKQLGKSEKKAATPADRASFARSSFGSTANSGQVATPRLEPKSQRSPGAVQLRQHVDPKSLRSPAVVQTGQRTEARAAARAERRTFRPWLAKTGTSGPGKAQSFSSNQTSQEAGSDGGYAQCTPQMESDTPVTPSTQGLARSENDLSSPQESSNEGVATGEPVEIATAEQHSTSLSSLSAPDLVDVVDVEEEGNYLSAKTLNCLLTARPEEGNSAIKQTPDAGAGPAVGDIQVEKNKAAENSHAPVTLVAHALYRDVRPAVSEVHLVQGSIKEPASGDKLTQMKILTENVEKILQHELAQGATTEEESAPAAKMKGSIKAPASCAQVEQMKILQHELAQAATNHEEVAQAAKLERNESLVKLVKVLRNELADSAASSEEESQIAITQMEILKNEADAIERRNRSLGDLVDSLTGELAESTVSKEEIATLAAQKEIFKYEAAQAAVVEEKNRTLAEVILERSAVSQEENSISMAKMKILKDEAAQAAVIEERNQTLADLVSFLRDELAGTTAIEQDKFLLSAEVKDLRFQLKQAVAPAVSSKAADVSNKDSEKNSLAGKVQSLTQELRQRAGIEKELQGQVKMLSTELQEITAVLDEKNRLVGQVVQTHEETVEEASCIRNESTSRLLMEMEALRQKDEDAAVARVKFVEDRSCFLEEIGQLRFEAEQLALVKQAEADTLKQEMTAAVAQEKTSLASEAQTLKQELHSSQVKSTWTEEEVHFLSAQSKALRQETHAAAVQQRRSSAEICAVKQALASSELNTSRSEEQCQSLSVQVEAIYEQKQLLLKQSESMEQEVSAAFAHERSSLSSEVKMHKQELAASELNRVKLREELESLSDKVKALDEDKQSTLEGRSTRYSSTASSEVRTLKQGLASSDLPGLDLDSIASDEECESLRLAVRKFEAEIESLKLALHKSEYLRQQATVAVEEERSAVSRKGKTLQDNKQQVEELLEEKTSLLTSAENDRESLTHELLQRDNELLESLQESEFMETSRRKFEDEVAQLSSYSIEEYNFMENLNRKFEEEIARLSSTVEHDTGMLRTQAAVQESRMHHLEQQLAAQESRNEYLEHQVASLQAEPPFERASLESHQHSVSRHSMEVTAVHEMRQKYEGDVAQLQSIIAEEALLATALHNTAKAEELAAELAQSALKDSHDQVVAQQMQLAAERVKIAALRTRLLHLEEADEFYSNTDEGNAASYTCFGYSLLPKDCAR